MLRNKQTIPVISRGVSLRSHEYILLLTIACPMFILLGREVTDDMMQEPCEDMTI